MAACSSIGTFRCLCCSLRRETKARFGVNNLQESNERTRERDDGWKEGNNGGRIDIIRKKDTKVDTRKE